MTAERSPDGLLSGLLDSVPDGILVVSLDGRIMYVNRAAEEIFGYPPGGLVGELIEQLVPGDLRARHAAERDRYAADPWTRPLGHVPSLVGLRADGSELALDISLAPAALEGADAVVAVVRDAGERLAVEERLRDHAQAAAVEEIVAALGAMVWESRSADRRRLSYVGGRAEALLGHPRSRWLQEGFWASVVHPDDLDAALEAMRGARERDRIELNYRVVSRAGKLREVRDIVSVSRGANGEVERLRGVITDVTERAEVAARVSEAQKMQAVGQLAGGIAHDFNNLLTIVSGYARRLLARPELVDARDDLEQILTASDRAAQLTRQLLAFAQRGHGTPDRIDLLRLIRELEPMLRRLLAADIVLDFRPQHGLAPVMMDRARIEQVVMNLVINAADAMPAGGTLRILSGARRVDHSEAELRGVSAGAYVELSVSDTGTGMSPETAQRIFEPFFSTKGEGGTGMGLATVYGVVDQAGGWVEVDTELGRGSAFTVVLPAAEDALAPRGAHPAATLLLVEDEPALRHLVATMLAEQGYQVLRAGDGEDALAVAAAHRGPIDLLVTDVVMPRLSGPELADRLRASLPALEVLFMSGYNDSRFVSRGQPGGGDSLLVKPFTPEQLVARVSALIDRRPARSGH